MWQRERCYRLPTDDREEQHVNPDDVQRFIASANWRSAKTLVNDPDWPRVPLVIPPLLVAA
jgi:hypothetical protein